MRLHGQRPLGSAVNITLGSWDLSCSQRVSCQAVVNLTVGRSGLQIFKEDSDSKHGLEGRRGAIIISSKRPCNEV